MNQVRPIFVFGSNLAGRHGKGAARTARFIHGAVYGQAEGRQGMSYAIPTKDAQVRHALPLSQIQEAVDRFLAYARAHPQLTFQVTRIGCGLSGLRDQDIAPMFHRAPANCLFDTRWMDYPPPRGTMWSYWGTFDG